MSEVLKSNNYSDLTHLGDQTKLKLEFLALRSAEKNIDIFNVAEYLMLLADAFSQATKKSWQSDRVSLNIKWFTELSMTVKPLVNKRLLYGETRDNGLGIHSAVVGEIPENESFYGDLLYWNELRNCMVLQHKSENPNESDWVMLKNTNDQSDFAVADIKPLIDQKKLTKMQENGKILDVNKNLLAKAIEQNTSFSNGHDDFSNNRQPDIGINSLKLEADELDEAGNLELAKEKRLDLFYLLNEDPLKAALAACELAATYQKQSDVYKEVNPNKSQELLDEADFWLNLANEYEQKTDQGELLVLSYGQLVAKAVSLYKTNQYNRSEQFIDIAQRVALNGQEISEDLLLEDLPDPQEAYNIAASYQKMVEDSYQDSQTRIELTHQADKWLNIYNDLIIKCNKNAEHLLDKAKTSKEDTKTRIAYTYQADSWLDKANYTKEFKKPGLTTRFKLLGKNTLKVFKPKKIFSI